MSIESVMPSNHLISVVSFSPCLQTFPSSGSFLMSQFFTSGGQSSGAPASGEVIKVIKNTKQDTRPILVHGFMVLVPSPGRHMPMLYYTAWSSYRAYWKAAVLHSFPARKLYLENLRLHSLSWSLIQTTVLFKLMTSGPSAFTYQKI